MDVKKIAWYVIFKQILTAHTDDIYDKIDDDQIDIERDLQTPTNTIMQVLLQIYSYQTPFYDAINNFDEKTRYGDTETINNLGPFAWVLARIFWKAQVRKIDIIKDSFTCYRCCRMPVE